MTKDTIRQIGVILATVIMLTVHVIADLIPINGMTTMEVSSLYNVYFLPAHYAFLIWPLIYLGLLVYTIYQALPSQKENPVLRKIGWWHVSACLAIASWMFFFHYRLIIFSTLMMVYLLIALLFIYVKLNYNPEKISNGMRFLVNIPFSIYLGWITMATIANISGFLYISSWNGLGVSPKIWAVVMIVLTIVLAELTAFNRQDLVYLAVIIWAFIGIAVKQIGVSPIFEAACVAAGFVFIMAVITMVVKPKLNKQS